MPRAVPIQTAMNAGEWSWPMYGRVDHPGYYKSCRQMRNMFPMVQGPAVRRGGTKYVAGAQSNSVRPRLIPFEFSTTQAYVLEFSNQLFRIFRDNGIVISGTPVEVTTPYATAHLPTLQYAQSADTLYVVHPSYAPRKITRTSHTTWTVTEIDFWDGPYLSAGAAGGITITPGATSGSTTWTASSALWASTDVGRLFRIFASNSTWYWVEITGYTSSTVVTGTAYTAGTKTGATLPNTNAIASNNYRLGAWSDTTGWPATVTFFQDRLCFGGRPVQNVNMSVTGDYENMKPSAADGTVADDDAISITLNANNVNVIRWLTDDEKALVCGTIGGEWLIRADTLGGVVTPSNVQATRSTTFGSANVKPLKVDVATLFVQRAGFKLHEHAYVFETDGFRSPDLTRFAREITNSTSGGITEMAYQQEPDRIVWLLRADGRLVGMTYSREEEVVAFHLHTIGGYSDSGQTSPAVVESITVIPSSDGSRDELWLAVRRYINGETVRYIEYMTASLGENADQEDAIYVDSALTYDGAPVTTVTGATHLVGQTARLLVDGATHPDETVNGSGEVALDVSGSVVQLGLAYTSTLETMNLEAGAADGTAQTRVGRIDRVFIRFQRTLGGQAGPDTDNLDDIPDVTFRDPATAMDSPPPLFSGDAEISFSGGYERSKRIVWQSSAALPATILAIVPHVVTNQR